MGFINRVGTGIRNLVTPKQHVVNLDRRAAIKTMGRAALIGTGLALAASCAALTASESSAFVKTLLDEGYDLGQFTVDIATEAAAGQIIDLQIPINIDKGYGDGLATLDLVMRLSTDFADFPVYISGWNMEIDGESFPSTANFTEQLINGGEGTESLIDLPKELNSSGVIWPTSLTIQLRVDSSEATIGKDYSVPVDAILQGIK